MNKENFFVAAYEPGFHTQDLPTWTDRGVAKELLNPQFDIAQVSRQNIDNVPGAFQLLNVLTDEETQKLAEVAEMLGYSEDSPVSLPHSVRHNENFNWVVSEGIDQELWRRSKHLIPEVWQDEKAQGINARFRFYKYKKGDFFKPHSDGAWPGSRVVGKQLIGNAYPDLFSQYTYLIFLSDDYAGGRTQFMVSASNPDRPARSVKDTNVVNIRTPKGAVLCFPHGTHPLHCLHASEEITAGEKIIIRTDILFGK